MTTSTKLIPIQIDAYPVKPSTETLLPRAVAAVSLVAGAYLLLTGRRRSALAAIAAGTAAIAIEKPEVVEDIWRGVPGYLRTAQDALLRAERAVEDIRAKGEHIRSILSRP